jgi:hypothetical protein
MALHYFTLYSSLNAVMWGSQTLGAVVLRKTLHASELQVSLLSVIGSAALLLGIFGSEYIMGRDKRPYILWVGLIGRAILLLYLLCYHPWTFIIISGLFSISHALFIPATFSWWQANVSSEARSRLWGLNAVVTTIISMLAAYLSGVLLHWHAESFRLLFGCTGIVGMLGVYILARAPVRGLYKLAESQPATTLQQIVVQPVRSFMAILLRDRRFLHFEAAYFMYGCALMFTFPTLPIYIADRAQMNYEQAGLALGILSQVPIVLLSTSWGRMMDLRGPVTTSALTFFVLALFPTILLLGPLHESAGIPLVWGVYASQLIQGIGMAGVNVTWSLAPICFAGNQDSSQYSGAHVTLTGIRGAIMPALGALGLSYFGFTPVFVASAVCFTLAALGMLHLHWRHPELSQPLVNGDNTEN